MVKKPSQLAEMGGVLGRAGAAPAHCAEEAPAAVHTLLLALAPLLLQGTSLEAIGEAVLPGGGSAPASVAAATGEPVFVGGDGQRITGARLGRFLAARGSPLARYARRIVEAGLRHRVDPRWVVAIAGTETYFGRYHKGHNAWGWDAPNGLRRWPSWEEAIDSYTLHFARGYRSRDPLLIGARYAPFEPLWPETTRMFFSRIRGPSPPRPRPDLARADEPRRHAIGGERDHQPHRAQVDPAHPREPRIGAG